MMLHALLQLAAASIVIGSPLPAWQEGCLDIHAVNSARGECTFFILPDGTTMLLDAGEAVSFTPSKYSKVPARPDSLTRPSEVYVRYIRHFLPAVSDGALDYAVLTHYHMDHMGRVEEWMTPDPVRGYPLTGLAAVEARIPFRQYYDRAWPAWEESRLVDTSGGGEDFYPQFVSYACRHDGMKAEAFRPGSTDQVVLRHKPRLYRNFRVLGCAASGMVWDGSSVVNAYEGKTMRENGASCCMLLSYGKFDYYSGGDAGGNSPVALPVARMIGRPVEAMKADHHFSYHTMKDETMDILQPAVVVTQSFFERDIQPDVETLAHLQEGRPWGESRFYFTNIGPRQRAAHPEVYSRVAGMNGHVVIRVLPGGRKYYVIMLDDSDFEYRVKSVDGPYRCK